MPVYPLHAVPQLFNFCCVDYASRVRSASTFSLKPPLSDGDAGSAAGHFGDTFFETEVKFLDDYAMMMIIDLEDKCILISF